MLKNIVLHVAAIAVAMLSLTAFGQPEPTKRIDVPAGDLVAALESISKQADVELVFQPEQLKGLRTDGVSGQLSVQDAVKRLLQGTQLKLSRDENTGAMMIGAATSSIKTSADSAKMGPTNLRLAQTENSQNQSSAQNADDKNSDVSSETSEDKNKIQEVVVTAQKRVEKLKDVPISISVLSGKDLDKSSAQGVLEELSRVPGVVASSTNNGTARLAVRGVAAGGDVLNGSSPVSYYLDSVPFGFVRTAFAPDTSAYDLQRIEVLRGPQGTLYGASAGAGVVRVLTNDADLHDFSIKSRLSVAATDGGNESNRADVAVNIPLVLDKLAVRGVVDYGDLGGWVDIPGDKDANDARLRNYRLKVKMQPTADLSAGLSAWSTRDHYDSRSDSSADGTNNSVQLPTPITNDFDAYSANVAYQFSRFTVSSATSYIDHTNDSNVDLAAFGLGGFRLFVSFGSRVLTEEVNLNSTNEGAWRWTAGAIYRDVRDHENQYVPNLANVGVVNFVDKSRSYAAYGELTRRFLADKLALTLGVRQFHDDVSTIKGIPTPPSYDESESFNATTPRAVLMWNPNANLTIYGSYSQGFRSGEPQYYAIGTVAPNLPAVKPDRLHNYEIGLKADWLEHRLSLDSAIYFMDWRDVQQSVLVPYAAGLINAQVNGEAASGPGIEAALTVRPIHGLDIGASFSWNDLTLENTVLSGNAVLFNKGDRLNGSSEYTAGTFTDYSFSLGGGYTARFSASANYTSKQSVHSTLGVKFGDNLLIARSSLSVIFPQQWSVQLYADNISNEDGAIAGAVGTLQPRPRPRTWGLQVDYQFK